MPGELGQFWAFEPRQPGDGCCVTRELGHRGASVEASAELQVMIELSHPNPLGDVGERSQE